MKIAIVLSAIMLVGCSTAKNHAVIVTSPVPEKSPVSGKPLEEVKKVVNIDPYLLEPCPAMPPMLISNPSANDALATKAKETAIYVACQGKLRELVKVVKDAFNIK